MGDGFFRYADVWDEKKAIVLQAAPTLKAVLNSCDIKSELMVLDNYVYLIDKLTNISRDLLKLREEAAVPSGKPVNSSQINALTQDLNKMGDQVVQAGKAIKTSSKSIATKLTKLGDSVSKARESQDISSAGNDAIRNLVNTGVSVLKVITGPLSSTPPTDMVAAIKRDPGAAPVVRSG